MPNEMDIGNLTQRDVYQILFWLNRYPREQLGYKSSFQMSTLKIA